MGLFTPTAPLTTAKAFRATGPPLQVDGLTAAATRIDAPERPNMRRLAQAWQQLALAYYDAIPEIHYCGNFYARSMQNVRFFVGERDADGEIKPSKDEKAIELLNRVQDPGGGRRQMTSRYGQLAFITGESLLMWSEETDEEEEIWEIVSPDELRPDGADGYVRFRAPALGGTNVRATADSVWEPVPGTSIVYRMWTPHPRYSWLADAPMRGVLDICKELLTLTQAVNAMAISHAARAGILLVPDELDFVSLLVGEDEDPNVNVFQKTLTKALTAAVADPSAPEALSPLVVTGKAEFLHPDVFRKLALHDEREKYPEENLRAECIRRIALGVDMPPEELLGKADVNHWTSWEISEDAWRHVEPIAWGFADSLASSYLRRTARKEGIKNWQRLCIGVDESGAVVKPDRGASASEVAKQGGIKLEALRGAHDFTDGDKMDNEEYQTWLAVQLNDPDLLPDKWKPQSYVDAKQQAADAKAAQAQQIPGQAPDGAQNSQATNEDIPRAEPQNAQPPPKNGAAVTAAVDQMVGAAEMAVIRAREKAGSRLKGAAQGCSDCRAQIHDMPPELIAATLGPEMVADLGEGDALALVAGGAESFELMAVRWGYSPVQARAIGEIIEMHAARNLFELDPPPVRTAVAGHIRRVAVGAED